MSPNADSCATASPPIQATGREHLGQTNDAPNPPTLPDAFNSFHTRLEHPGDGKAMGTYAEQYVYDAVGNFLQMQHRGADPAHRGWARSYDYAEASLVEATKSSNRLTRTTLNPDGVEPYLHDVHGNMIRMPHLGILGQPEHGVGLQGPVARGRPGRRRRGLLRLRRVSPPRAAPISANTAKLERETLHVMDDKQRVALVEQRTLDRDGDYHGSGALPASRTYFA